MAMERDMDTLSLGPIRKLYSAFNFVPLLNTTYITAAWNC